MMIQRPATPSDLALDPALSPADRSAVFRLRYRAWRAVNGVPPNRERAIRDELDDSPLARSYLLREDGRIIGSVRSTVYVPGQSVHRLFLHTLWPDLELPWLSSGGTVIESSRLVFDPDAEHIDACHMLRLLSVHNANAVAWDACTIVTAVQLRHIPFYRKRLRMDVASPILPVSGLNVESGAVMRMDFRAHIGEVEARFPEARVTARERSRLAIQAAALAGIRA